jgi:hypothetical protein
MNALRLVVPVILTVQFLLVLVALVSALLFAEPQFRLPSGRLSPLVRTLRRIGLQG